jgi:hypothetical protein
MENVRRMESCIPGMLDLEIGNENLSGAAALLKGALVTCPTQQRDPFGYRTIAIGRRRRTGLAFAGRHGVSAPTATAARDYRQTTGLDRAAALT